MNSNSKTRPQITPAPNGPYLVENLDNFSNRHGAINTKPKMALCRCGGSKNKPFCDGMHAQNGFSSDKQEDRIPDKRDNYEGRSITIHDNRGICAHAGRCTDGLPSVFRMNTEPWIDPDGASADAVAATIKQCPSGAISFTRDGVEHHDQQREVAIFVAPDGPYVVSGGPQLRDTERGEGASTAHFTLCRCGGSKNKPFCDGTHWHKGFKDDKN